MWLHFTDYCAVFSVRQELVCGAVASALQSKSIKFQSCGREDINVRMLGRYITVYSAGWLAGWLAGCYFMK